MAVLPCSFMHVRWFLYFKRYHATSISYLNLLPKNAMECLIWDIPLVDVSRASNTGLLIVLSHLYKWVHATLKRAFNSFYLIFIIADTPSIFEIVAQLECRELFCLLKGGMCYWDTKRRACLIQLQERLQSVRSASGTWHCQPLVQDLLVRSDRFATGNFLKWLDC